MKKLKKMIVLFTAALFCLLPILSQPLTVQASTPTTYYLKFIEANNEWRFLKDVTVWDDTAFHRELYYMQQDIKDGDTIVIDSSKDINLTVYVKLANLTVLNSTMAVVTANGYDEVYIANGSTAAVNGDVANGYVLNSSIANFNNNVGNLQVNEASAVNVLGNLKNLYMYDPTNPQADITCAGTVDYVKSYDDDYLYYEYYNFAKGSMVIDFGNVMTDASKYSTTAPAGAATPSAPATSTGSSSAGEYDDVPKTGDFSVSPVWFLAIAAVCMLGYFKLERR